MIKTLLKNSALTMMALALLGVSQLIFNIVIGRTFGPETLGNVNLAIATALLLSALVSSGLFPANTKYLSEYLGKKDEESTKKVFNISLYLTILLSSILALVVFIFQNNLSSILNVEKNILLLGIPLVILYPLYLLLRGTYYGLNQVKKYLKRETISRLLFFFAILIVLYTQKNFLLPFIMLYTTFILFSVYDFRSHLMFSGFFDTNLFNKILRFSGIALVGGFASVACFQLGTLLTGYYIDPIEVGFYSAAFSIITIFYFIPNSLSSVLFPSISQKYGENDHKSINRLLNVTTRWMVLYIIPLCGVSILLSDSIIDVVYGSNYESSSIVLKILLVSVLSIMATPSITSLSGTRYVKIPTLSSILAFMIRVVLWVVLIPRYGIIGTAIGFTAGSFVDVVVPLYFSWKLFGMDVKRIFRIVLSGLLVFLITLFSIDLVGNVVVSVVIFITLYVTINLREFISLKSLLMLINEKQKP